jgi:hypothetical protein
MKFSLLSLILTIFITSSVKADVPVVINELMASNNSSIQDPQGQYDDWIELFNSGSSPVHIGGMYLTDDLSAPTKWQIPISTTIPSGGYLVIWADNDITDAGLHANFKLDAAGEEIGLFDSDGITLIDWILFPKQATDISYGRYPDATGDWRFFGSPSPGDNNQGGFPGIVADTKFSRDRGFYDTPFSVIITTDTAGATIRYTTDASTPTETHGQLYTGPVLISTTTCLRAAAFKTGWMPTNVDTHTYIFLDDVIKQPEHPAGFPTSGWGHAGPDYQMDPVVVGAYSDTIEDDLKSIPTLSLVMDTDDWFGNKGIYVNSSQDGTERIVSMEFIDPNSGENTQINCAIAMQGGVSGGGTSLDRWKIDKLSMRLKFKEDTDDGTPTGGPTKLHFKVFTNSPVDSFDTLVLDARLGNTWPYGGTTTDHGSRPWISGRSIYQPDVAQYTRDQFVADIQNALGGYSHHGRHVHLYLNGLYWGIYNLHERPDHRFAAAYFGGNADDYDCLKHNSSMIINGSNAGFNQMMNIAESGLASDQQYQLIKQYLDVDNFIDYLIPNYFVGNYDWGHKNWYATHNAADPNGLWHFHHWDGEHLMENLNENVTSRDNAGGPSHLQQKLAQNAEYRLLFADHVHRHFFNDGALTPEGAAALYQIRLNDVDRAVVGESARWGDNQIDRFAHIRYMRDPHWLLERDWLLGTYFPSRTSIVLNQFKSKGWYPNVDAPEFLIDGSYQHGGVVSNGDILSMTASSGTILYTLDDTDPRASGTQQQAPDTSTILINEDAQKYVLVPTEPIDDTWKGGGLFNDSSWASGTGGIGYDTGSEYRNLFQIDLYDQMYQKQTSCYIRIPFTVTQDLRLFSLMTLKMRYDDGFIAYLNGVELDRRNFAGTPSWNSSADTTHADSDAVNFENIDVSSHLGALWQGDNILAIHGLNQSTTSTDFLISTELAVSNSSLVNRSDISRTANVYAGPFTLTESVHVKARVKSGDTWSALNEATYAVGPVTENLRITELMYHPFAPADANDPNEEFIELTNIGTETINLNLVKFTNGIDFTFPSLDLAPGEFVVVVEDIDAFVAKYGTGVTIAGQYTGRLANNGERIRLEDAVGQTILDFSYKDGWYDGTDGGGFSLTIKDPTNPDPQSWDDKNTWQPSTIIDGSPGL